MDPVYSKAHRQIGDDKSKSSRKTTKSKRKKKGRSRENEQSAGQVSGPATSGRHRARVAEADDERQERSGYYYILIEKATKWRMHLHQEEIRPELLEEDSDVEDLREEDVEEAVVVATEEETVEEEELVTPRNGSLVPSSDVW